MIQLDIWGEGTGGERRCGQSQGGVCGGSGGCAREEKNGGRKVADFRLPNKTKWTLDYSPEKLCLHLQLAVNTVHW